MKDDDLTRTIIGCAYKVHNALGPGFLEKIYENALRIELEKLGFNIKQQEPLNVRYEGQVVGEYFVDLWVNGRLVIELKAVQALTQRHEVQLVNCLTATGVDNGLLLNFGRRYKLNVSSVSTSRRSSFWILFCDSIWESGEAQTTCGGF